MKFLSYILFIFLFSFFGPSVFAAVMESPSYKIPVDSLNVGGLPSSSTSYRLRDTIGEIATSEMTSPSYKLRAGYQPMLEIYLSISAPDDVTMTPDIPGLAGGTSDGQAIWTVKTDNLAGYTLNIKASTSPALKSNSFSFANYTPANSGIPDFIWSIASSDSEFGFTPEGNHIISKYKDNNSACNVGALDTLDRCWYYLFTTPETISQSSSSNHPSGTTTNVKFKAQSGSSHLQEEGTYQATVTVTAVAN